MGTLLIVCVLLGLVAAALVVAFYARVWSTLGVHRRAMDALHQELSQRRLDAQFARQQRITTEEGYGLPRQDRP